jgi:hypothetical protein
LRLFFPRLLESCHAKDPVQVPFFIYTTLGGLSYIFNEKKRERDRIIYRIGPIHLIRSENLYALKRNEKENIIISTAFQESALSFFSI